MESTTTAAGFNVKAWPKLRRGNSVPPTLDIPSKINGQDLGSALELHHFNEPTYTSLRDLLPGSPPAGIHTPTCSRSFSCQIPIKNRLVKQAAYAYLQPMPSSSETRGGLYRWIRDGMSCADEDSSADGCFGFFGKFCRWLFARLLPLICIPS